MEMKTSQKIFRGLKQILRQTPARHLVQAARARSTVRHWKDQGRPVPPPPPFKQSVVRHYGRKFHLQTLVETGTYLGEMITAQSRHFKHIHSIELDPALFAQAKQRFAHLPHVTLRQGDSSQVLPTILSTLNGPCLFWLDAHYSGDITARGSLDTPIIQELELIFQRNNPGDIILIDDARCFDGTNDYPTLTELQRFIATAKPNAKFEAADDIIRVYRL